MPVHADLPPDVAASLPDELYGDVRPRRKEPQGKAVDARTAALRALFAYLARVDFLREGPTGGPLERFRIPPENFFVEWPESVVQLPFPSIVARDARGTFVGHGLGPPTLFDETIGVTGQGTALIRGDEYVEDVQLEVWARTRAERRGLCAALDVVFTVSQERAGIQFSLTEYHGQTAHFMPCKERQFLGEQMNAMGRRQAVYVTELRVVTVRAVNVQAFRARVALSTE